MQGVEVALPLDTRMYADRRRLRGVCEACRLRAAAFRQLGLIDSAPYDQPPDWTGCAPYRGPSL